MTGATLFNITSKKGDHWNCIDETLNTELDFGAKKSFQEIPFFDFLREMFRFAGPEEAVIIFTEGAEVGWFPLERRESTLSDFCSAVYEYRDRTEYDVHGVFRIVGGA